MGLRRNVAKTPPILRKGKRLKQAKEEAIAEIDHYRLQREKDFRRKHSKIMGSHDNLSTKIDEETAAKIQGLTNNYHKNMENVLGHLLGKVYDINPDIHPNYTYTI
ncbi:V-type proton ATPase subunit G 3 [Crotalus adamanteus]|uniref:V-type proton ATPase subunit G n=1 Tax=Crotalus adamanteus TaxID=8729 RepID=A0AAW1BQE6_CROAD|nr:V-type proton ATPase subunit G 3 isoform X3 [Crotalus tigris]